MPQTISDFALIDFAPSARKTSAVPATPTGVLSIPHLEKVAGRLYVFLLDDHHLNVMHTPRAKELVRSFIRDRMAPGDAVAVVLASGTAKQDSTHR